MDDTWQSKCHPMWLPSTPAAAQFQPQDSRNEMMNASHNFYPNVVQEPSSSTRKMMTDSLFPFTSNSNLYNSGHVVLGSPLLSLLSGAPSLVQCDQQQLSNSKPFIPSSKVPVSSSSFVVGPTGHGVSLVSPELLLQSLNNCYLKSRIDICPVVSSGTAASVGGSSASCLHDVLQAGNVNDPSLELAKAVNYNNSYDIEQVKGFSSLRAGPFAIPCPVQTGKLHRTSSQALQKLLGTCSSVPHQSSTITSGCPRVFCLYASGDLLLSNTGLLGVVCSCHGLHMSISKFSEHSGLRDVNPGDAVHMDSGETIAQWRRVYFFKIGIRIPEDRSGWDWPEGFSAAPDSVKSSGMVPNMSGSTDLSNSIGTSGAFVVSKQPFNNVVCSNNPHTGQKFVNEVVHNEIQRNAQDSCKFLNGFIGTSQSNVHSVSANNIVDLPTSEYLSMSKLVGGAENDFRSNSTYIDPISKRKSSFISCTNLQNLRTPGRDSDPTSGCFSMSKLVGGTENDFRSKSTYIDPLSKTKSSFISLTNLPNLRTTPGRDSDIFKLNNSRDGDILDKAAVSSNIELRLGQPSLQNRTLGNSHVPGFNTHPINRPHHPQELISREPQIHNRGSTRIMEECRRYPNHAAHTDKSSTTKEKNHLEFVNHASGVYSARKAVRTEQLKGDVAGVSVISTLFSHSSKDPHTMANGGHIMPKQRTYESQNTKSDLISFPCNRDNRTEPQFNINDLGNYKLTEKDTGLRHAAVSEHVAQEPNLGCHMKFMGGLSSCGFGKISRDTCSVVHERSCHVPELPEIAADASDARIPFNYSATISSLGRNGHLDHNFLRSVSSPPMDSGTLPSQALSMGVFAMTKNSFPNMTSTLSKDEGIGVNPHLLYGNLPMLSSRQVVEYSNQDRVTASPRTNRDQGTFISSLNDKVKSSLALPSKSTKRNDGQDLESRDDSFELPMKSLNSGITYWTDGGSDKSAAVAAVSQQTSLHLGDIGMQCYRLCNSHTTEQPLLRFGGSENNIRSSCEHGKCCQSTSCAYIPDKCRCSVHENCLGGNCTLKGKTSLGAFREQPRSVSDRASMLSVTNLDKHCTFLKEKAISSDEIGDFTKPNLKKDDSNAFKWKDVPSKMTGMCNVTCKDQLGKLLDGRTNVEDLVSDVPSKCFNVSAQKAECLREQAMSNISSKCSGAAITQASVKASNGDSCIDDAQNTGCSKHLVVDEGSAIGKSSSSDEALESRRNTQFDSFACKFNSTNEASSKAIPDQPSRSLIDELRLRDSLRLKILPNPIHTGLTIQEEPNSMQNFAKDFEAGKRKRETKWKSLDVSFPTSAVSPVNNENQKSTGSSEGLSHCIKDLQQLVQPSKQTSHNCACPMGPSFKRRRSTLSPSITACPKKDVHRLDNNREGETFYQTLRMAYDDCIETPESSRGRRLRLDQAFSTTQQVRKQEANYTDAEITVKCDSLNPRIASSSQQVNVCRSIVRPVVCGKYGIISNGATSKPVKILSVGKIYRITRRCNLAELSALKLSQAKGGQGAAVYSDLNPFNSVKEIETACYPGCKIDDDVSCMLENGRHGGNSIPDCGPSTRLKRKSKEVCKRSLYELTSKGKDPSCASFSDTNYRACVPQTNFRYLKKFPKNGEDSNNLVGGVDNSNSSTEKLRNKSIPDVDVFCCVCGCSNNDEINLLLDCNRCLIRVHQACYGISRVPKTRWYCRPCKTSSKNIVCVLCGYRGGVMTRALRSSNIVKSLLNTWNVVTEARPENSTLPSQVLEDRLNVEASSRSQVDLDAPPSISPAYIQSSSVTVWKKDLQKELVSVKNSSCPISDSKVLDSITAGVLDSTVMQWVHMVCGLWTPGTRCPNVDTMSAFDVSGASCPKGNVVCSMCNRPGGCCISCRVMDCPIHFHPWCAHQKGLLQSEIEGADDEKVGFYGRCELHAAEHHCHYDTNCSDIQSNCPGDKEITCARTEGYKGRKREGYRHNILRLSNGTTGECLVPQEQLDAWLHINRQKSSTKGVQKLPLGPVQDNEYDYRKEYTRYKQLKGWKHLVVYKSGIHALGLYTSCFILCGAMVVEYVGEIVGLRVADRRESEYQSGKKLQYKSACYFFRIDKEHIIDATRKGGIARFVNHSCLPNCVAKVITVKNEKKVVFFAERDIYPGEEITYDYHFNHEDEGKKIPCFCNSKNCRRYLN